MDIKALKIYLETTYNIKVDVKARKIIGDIDLKQKGLKSLPDFSDWIVTGDFYCYTNNLASLKGAPKEVGGNFDCSKNQLENLKGAPRKVGGNFDCWDNQLKNLKGAPEKVGGNFICWDNQLKNLKGAPEKVGGNFCCQDNPLRILNNKAWGAYERTDKLKFALEALSSTPRKQKQ